MALALGTNCGFVTVAPSADPATGISPTIDFQSHGLQHTLPADAVTITEIGFWVDSQGDSGGNWEVGIYDDDGSDYPSDAIGRDQTNVLPSGSEVWVSVTGLSIDVSSHQSTLLWIAVQVDNVSPEVLSDMSGTGEGVSDTITGQTTLTDPYTDSSPASSTRLRAMYAVYTTGGEAVPLAGSSDSVSTVGGPIKIVRKIVASSAGTSVMADSAMLVARKLIGSFDATSTLTGSLARIVGIIGSSDGISTIGAPIKVARKLVASSDGVSALTGSLVRSLALSGSSDAVATLIGAMLVSGGVITLAGSIDAVSALTGSANLALSLSGNINAVSLFGGTLYVPSVPQDTYIVYTDNSLFFYIDGVVVMRLDNE